MQTQALLGRPAKTVRPSTDLESFLTRYFEWARNVKQKGERSIVTEKTAIKQFLNCVSVRDLTQIHAESVDTCVAGMKKGGYKLATINIVPYMAEPIQPSH